MDDPVDNPVDDPARFVPVWEGPFLQAQERLGWLESAHIPCDLGDATVVGHARVEVAEGYEDEAMQILASGPRAPTRSSARSMSSPFAWWTAVVALLLAAALVLARLL